MPKFDPHILRKMAEEFLKEFAPDLSDEEREDIATSLVRQWITYDGRAAVFADGHEHYLLLRTTPLGNPAITPMPAGPPWTRVLLEDWKINPDDLPEAFQQLNRGQSAEVVNQDETPLQLWAVKALAERLGAAKLRELAAVLG